MLCSAIFPFLFSPRPLCTGWCCTQGEQVSHLHYPNLETPAQTFPESCLHGNLNLFELAVVLIIAPFLPDSPA